MARAQDRLREKRLRSSGALSPQQSQKVILAQLMEEGGITERDLSGGIPTWAYLTAAATLATATFFTVRLYRRT